ncbi:MAG: histidine phosphatase family protein [Lachnospiraceae bacterium]|nr:histidine phosphatase family protein [Lachnospiraceae bacterium]MBR5917573.1 histidine phosphatase family protein [Lachnospiraceae bacterium]
MRNSAEDKIRIVIVRHGATATNADKRYCGKRSDEDLSDEGIAFVKRMIEKGVYPTASMLFVSPKKRAKSTAKLIYPELEQIVIDEFDEIDFGDFEGKNHAELDGNPDYQKWIDSNGETAFPNGESKDDLCKRVTEGFLKVLDIIEEAKEEISDIAIVAHGGTIMALLSTFAGMNYFNCLVSNAKGYVVEMVYGYPDSMKIAGIIE